MEWRSHNLSVRLDDIASQSDSSVWLQYGNTVVLATVVMSEKAKECLDFIPLSVHYIEKAYAVKRIPGGFIKREGRGQDHESLISRMIDRSLRPLIEEGLQNEVQVIIHVLSYDPLVGSLVPSFLAASIAMQRSPVPFKGPIAMCHVGILNDEIIINPTVDQLKKINSDFIIAGTSNKLIMIEGGAAEISLKQLSAIVKAGIEAYQPIVNWIKSLPLKKSTKKAVIIKPTKSVIDLVSKYKKDIKLALTFVIKKERRQALQELLKNLIKKYPKINSLLLQKAFELVEKAIFLENLVQTKKRMDGRGLEDIRPIKIEVKPLPVVHGSALFTRGETQILATLTIGKIEEKQSVDELSGYKAHSFMFHYNFLPFCVGEVDKISAPSRREIGHGQLAYRALLPMLPDRLYTYRIVSEVLSCNGSSSMASVCAGSLCLMDGGIRIKRHVAGIALGLMKYKNETKILVDIVGDEDHLGLMDLKICGTQKGINAIQMDVSLKEGLSLTMFNKAIKTGHKAILKIIEMMNKAKKYPSKELPEGVPKIEALEVEKLRMRQVFGKKGEGARDIEKTTETRIDMQDSGRVLISSKTFKNIFAAKKLIYQALNEFIKGQVYDAKIYSIEDNKFLIKVKEIFIGSLVFDKSLKKIKNGDPIKVEYLKLDHKGELEFRIINNSIIE